MGEKKSFVEQLQENHPGLVAEYAEMSKEELLEQICAEVLDLHAMNDRVQLFMNECTVNLSKTTYTLDAIKTMITEKQEHDINMFCWELVEDEDPENDRSILEAIKDRASQIDL